MRTFALLLFTIISIPLISQSKTVPLDTIGTWTFDTKSKIMKFNNLNKRFFSAKRYEGNILHWYRKDNHGVKMEEYYRYNDSLYYYAEFNEPKTDEDLKSIRMIRQGLVKLSQITHGDTVTRYDYDTYEPSSTIAKLIIPEGKWTYFKVNGFNQARGSYKDGRKHGEWELTNHYTEGMGELIQSFENGVLVSEKAINAIRDKKKSATKEKLIGDYFIQNWAYSKTKRRWNKNPNLEDDWLGHRRIFNADYTFTLISRNLDPDGNIFEDAVHGTWRLKNFETLELTINGEVTVENIDYLSDDFMKNGVEVRELK